MLDRLDLYCFKCFEQLHLPVAPLTLLTGPNSAGKSSALQALVLLHQTMREHEWSTRLALNGDYIRLGAVPDVVDELFGQRGFGISVRGSESICEWRFTGDRQNMSMEVGRVTVDDHTVEAPKELRYLLPPDGPIPEVARQIEGLSYITAERTPPLDAYAIEDPHTVTDVGTRGEHAVSVLHWGRDEKVLPALVTPDAPPTRLRQVEQQMRTFFPGFSLDVQRAPRSHAVILGLRTSDATEFHRPAHTGFGLTQTLPIVVSVLSASKGDLVLIENPEVHLHPAAQARMGGFIADAARAGVQMLVETHSDHVLNGVRRAVKAGRLHPEQAAIHFFRPREENQAQVVSPVLDETGNIDAWPDGFFDQFDKDANHFAGWGD